MFSKFSFVSLSFVLASLAAPALASNSRLVPSPTEKLFVPIGYDDNDNVEVVVHGHFKNSCYKVGPADVKVDRQTRTVRVWPQSYEYSNAICAQMMVPFVQTIKLGNLGVGSYRVIVENNRDIKPQALPVVARHTEAPDDYLYAPVDDAKIVFGSSSANQSLVIEGQYPLTFIGCAIMQRVKTKHTGDVLVVQPVMEILMDNEECRARGWKPDFSFKIPLQNPLEPGDHLIHVRVLNGNSFNKVVEIID